MKLMMKHLHVFKINLKAGYLNEEEVLKTIKDCYEDNGYVLDTYSMWLWCIKTISKGNWRSN